MLDHRVAHLALRARLRTLSVCTTGAASISATTTGYARAAGSFLTDGFEVGMELVASGFATSGNNGVRSITGVTDLTLTTDLATTTEAAGTRTLAVGLPATLVLENLTIRADQGNAYVVEQYLPGPAGVTTIGALGRIKAEPMYSVQIAVPASTGMQAARRYAHALQLLFPPELLITLSTGDVLRVRGDTAPFVGQFLPSGAGFATIPVTIPLRCYSLNTI